MTEATSLIERLEALDAKATKGPWGVDGPAHNRIIWSAPSNRVAFMAHSGGDDPERDIATSELIIELRNNLPTIIASLKAQEASNGRR